MAAATEFRVLHGAAPGLGADVTGTTLRFKRADDDAQTATNPVPVPSAGYEYSWRKVFLLVATTAPDNYLSNLRFFANGVSLGTGRTVLFNTRAAAAYVQPSAADESSAISAVDVLTKTAVSPEVLQAGQFILSTDAFPTAGGANQPLVEVQMRVDSTASVGNSAAMELRYRYEEA